MQSYRGINKKIILFFSVFLVFYLLFQIGNFPAFLYFVDYSFKDFAMTNYAVNDMNPYLSGLSNYPPLLLIISLVFARMNDWSLYTPETLRDAMIEPSFVRSLVILMSLYVVSIFAICILFAVIKSKREQTKNKATYILIAALIALLFVISAPSRFLIDKGNYLVFIVIFLMLWVLFEELYPEKMTGSVFLSLAAATKLFPLYLFGTYIFEKKWKKLLVATISLVAVTVVPLLFFKGPIIDNVTSFIKLISPTIFGEASSLEDISQYGNTYAVSFTVGFTGFLGSLFELFGMFPRGFIIRIIWIIYAILVTICAFPLLKGEKKVWKKLFIVMALMVFLTPNSYLYNTCLMFAPIFVMLMDTNKIEKIDYPYYICAALMLVPKSYFYLASNWIPGSPDSYFNVSIAVVIDGLLYFGVITYYFAEKVIVYFKALKNIEENKKNKLVLLDSTKKIYEVVIFAVALLFGAYILYFCKDTVLACHDSVWEFIDARKYSFPMGFKRCIEFGLARGRVGIIFPCIVGIRYLINGTGNYLLIWLLQYVPAYSNIVLLGYIIGKKVNKVYGFIFSIVFFALLQIDIWHSLFTCYPLDFMYGLFIMILGLYLFSEYLQKKDDKNKRNVIRLIVSLVLYYESMQVYEAFIVSSLIYGWIAIGYGIKHGNKIIEKFKNFIVVILPHFCVAIVYLGILMYLRTHPVGNVPVQSFVTDFNFKRFVITYVVLSGGMFPLVDLRVATDILNFANNIPGVILGVIAIPAFIVACRYMGAHYSSLEKDARKRINKQLIIFVLFGLTISVTFALPHALLPIYEGWVVDAGVGGFLPSTICYFGWSLIIFSIVSLLSHYLSRVEAKKRMIVTIMLAVIFGSSVYLTCVINRTFKNTMSDTGAAFSRKVQAFYRVMINDDIAKLHPGIVFCPSMSGVHGNIKPTDSLFDKEIGYDIYLMNDYETFREVYQDYDLGMILIYDQDAELCYITTSDSYGDDYRNSFADTSIYVVSLDSGEYDLQYSIDVDGEMNVYTESVTIRQNELVEIPLSNPVVIGSIDFVRK